MYVGRLQTVGDWSTFLVVLVIGSFIRVALYDGGLKWLIRRIRLYLSRRRSIKSPQKQVDGPQLIVESGFLPIDPYVVRAFLAEDYSQNYQARSLIILIQAKR